MNGNPEMTSANDNGKPSGGAEENGSANAAAKTQQESGAAEVKAVNAEPSSAAATGGNKEASAAVQQEDGADGDGEKAKDAPAAGGE